MTDEKSVIWGAKVPITTKVGLASLPPHGTDTDLGKDLPFKGYVDFRMSA